MLVLRSAEILEGSFLVPFLRGFTWDSLLVVHWGSVLCMHGSLAALRYSDLGWYQLLVMDGPNKPVLVSAIVYPLKWSELSWCPKKWQHFWINMGHMILACARNTCWQDLQCYWLSTHGGNALDGTITSGIWFCFTFFGLELMVLLQTTN